MRHFWSRGTPPRFKALCTHQPNIKYLTSFDQSIKSCQLDPTPRFFRLNLECIRQVALYTVLVAFTVWVKYRKYFRPLAEQNPLNRSKQKLHTERLHQVRARDLLSFIQIAQAAASGSNRQSWAFGVKFFSKVAAFLATRIAHTALSVVTYHILLDAVCRKEVPFRRVIINLTSWSGAGTKNCFRFTFDVLKVANDAR